MTPTEEVEKTTRADELSEVVHRFGPEEAAEKLSEASDKLIAQVLSRENPALVDEILWEFSDERRVQILAAASPEQRDQWSRNHEYPEDSVGRLMSPPIAVLRPQQTVQETIEYLRGVVKKSLVTYGWVVEAQGRLIGVVVFRDLLFARPEQAIEEVMVGSPYFLTPEMSLGDAMKESLVRHFPVYPVCDAAGRLLGIVRGQSLFEQQTFELSAQAGTMVGVDSEERLQTPWTRSLKFRHPWLQLNLLTAFIAAAVVGVFQEELDQLVILAVFLPVLAGQSGNTGCQALAVALRGMTLGELGPDQAKKVVAKEALLGLLNGCLVGLTAGLGMFLYARSQENPSALWLSIIVFLAMIGSCTVSGLFGALVPLALRKLGADPATASSIFLTTATDVVSMGLFLSLASGILL